MELSTIKRGSLIIARGRWGGLKPYVVTDIPEHDPGMLGVAKSRESSKVRWIRRVDVVDILVP